MWLRSISSIESDEFILKDNVQLFEQLEKDIDAWKNCHVY
jgi:hypothetical protein